MPDFPQVLPPNTVYGRLGISSGPGEAVPFSAISGLLLGTVPTIAALAALPVPLVGSVAIFVTDPAQGGVFFWNPSNLSLGIANNPGQGIYVPPLTDITGASGAWVRQFVTVPGLANINASGPVNINTLSSAPFVTDGVTSNVPMFQSLAPVLQGVGREMPVPVNITVGTPTILSINPTVPSGGTLANPAIHYLKPNQAFYFTISAGGSLPAGISLNTLYYITAANLLATTFTFSAVNNCLFPTTEGATVNTTGSLTGTLSIVLTGRDISLFIPPGPYFGGNYADAVPNVNLTPSGISRIRYFAYGACFDTKVCFGGHPSRYMSDAKTWVVGSFDYVNTTPNDNNVLVDALITLVTTANAANYYVGQWIAVFGLNIQDGFGVFNSNPPNYHYQEFKQIKAINTGTGVITCDGPLKWVYLSTFPNMFTPTSTQIGGGRAMIAPMHPNWDTEIEVHGARYVGEATEATARRFMYKDCIFQGYGNFPGQAVPTVAQSFTWRNCRFGPGDNPGVSFMEIDKMIEYLELDGCTAPSKYRLQFSSTSLQVCSIKNHQGSSITGTPRNIKIADSNVAQLLVGPFFGVTDSVEVQNSRIEFFDMQERSDDNEDLGLFSDMSLVPNWTFSNGTFSRDLAIANHQAMLWQIPGTKVYMTDAGSVFKYYQNMGSPFTILNTYMSGSVFSIDTTLRAVPTRQTTIAITSITAANPAVVNTTAPHGLNNGDPVVLTTTGVLPLPLSRSVPYYVANKAASTFQLALTQAAGIAGTPVISTLGASQSGTHTAFGNPLCFRPHPCPRFTGIGNSGCSAIIDQNGTIDEPMFSRVRRAFVGKQNTGNPLSFQVPNPRIWGSLKSMTITVVQAGVASGTMTISCPGFTQPNLALSNFSQVIDTTVAGVRSWVGGAAPTGSAGADTIAAYADWVAGPLLFTWSAGVTLVNSPIVLFDMFTDQGLTRFGNMIGAPATPAAGFVWQYIDSGINQQFGSLP